MRCQALIDIGPNIMFTTAAVDARQLLGMRARYDPDV
jgi:hypothetical protein